MSYRRKRGPKRILVRMQRKLGIVFLAICILFVILLIRIMYIEAKSGDKYEKIVLSQQEYSTGTIPYQRGNIEDSKGTVLASSVDVYNVILDCKELNDEEEDIKPTMEVLSTCFPEVDIKDAEKRLKKKKNSRYQILARKVSYEEKKAFELEASKRNGDKNKKNNVTGIWMEKVYIRQYPYGSLAAQVIGFASSGNSGTIGLEKEYNDKLNGVNGRSYGYINEQSDVEKTVVEPENGQTIVTSLDTNIQTILEKSIQDWNAKKEGEGALGSAHTAALVMNPKTGEIYAMASYPFFDLSKPYDLSAYYSEDQVKAMTDKEKLETLNRIWQSYPVSSTYEPGSTFKTFTVASGLDSGALKGNETFFCNGYEKFGPDTVRCWKRSGHGQETVEGALRDSCNDSIMQMSYLIGAGNFSKYQSVFGFGQKTGIDLPGEANTAGLLYPEDKLASQTINLATNAFGQNFNVSMIQMASAFSSVVNGGKYYEPHLVTAFKDDTGNVTSSVDPVLLKETVSPQVSETMRRYLRTVVRAGTGKAAGVDGYSVIGKTGTAQKIPRAAKNYLVSFIAAVPAEDPEVVTYVIVDQPNVASQSTCHWAQFITHDVLTQILPYLNVPSIEEEKALGITTYDP